MTDTNELEDLTETIRDILSPVFNAAVDNGDLIEGERDRFFYRDYAVEEVESLITEKVEEVRNEIYAVELEWKPCPMCCQFTKSLNRGESEYCGKCGYVIVPIGD